MICLFLIIEILLISAQAFANDSCQVYPSEYAYQRNAVFRSERSSANCRPYGDEIYLYKYNYTYCDGLQLTLTDSDFGSEQYSSSDYYVWNAGSSRHQLLFIFPTRVNLNTITLHYYSDIARGLPRLRFYAVPDDFNIWNAISASYSFVYIVAVSPGGEPAGRRNVSVNVNFTTKKILMFKYRSDFAFALSEVEFFICINQAYTMGSLPATTTTTSTANSDSKTTVPYSATDQLDEITTTTKPQTSLASTTTTGLNKSIQNQRESTCSIFQEEAALAWALFGVVTVLFTVSFTVNVIMVALWVYKKREVKGQTGQPSEFEIEGNPCYEATQMKQTTETETHVYETVQGKRGK